MSSSNSESTTNRLKALFSVEFRAEIAQIINLRCGEENGCGIMQSTMSLLSLAELVTFRKSGFPSKVRRQAGVQVVVSWVVI